MKKFYKFSINALALTVLGLTTAQAQLYIIGEQISANDVNNSGVVSANSGNKVNIRWTKETGVQQIGVVTRDLLAGRTLVSEDGNKIIGYMTNIENNLNEISIYDVPTDSWRHLGGLIESSDAAFSSPWGISNDGTTIVGLGFINAGTGHAIKWTEADGIVDLGSTLAGRSSRANDINDDKSLVVGWQDDTGGFRQGAYWKNGVQTVLTDAAGNGLGEAGSVSGDGNIITGYAGINPYVYNVETKAVTIIEHPNQNTFFRGGATGISSDGKTVIGYYRPWPGGPYFGEGFIWTEEKGRINLNEYAKSLGIDLGTKVLGLPLAISPDGTKIVGASMDSVSNKMFGFYLDLKDYLAVSDTSTLKSNVSVYPNPVKNVLNISNVKNISKVEVYNMAGQKVIDASSEKVHVGNLSNGTYIINITADGKTSTTKFIKE